MWTGPVFCKHDSHGVRQSRPAHDQTFMKVNPINWVHTNKYPCFLKTVFKLIGVFWQLSITVHAVLKWKVDKEHNHGSCLLVWRCQYCWSRNYLKKKAIIRNNFYFVRIRPFILNLCSGSFFFSSKYSLVHLPDTTYFPRFITFSPGYTLKHCYITFLGSTMLVRVAGMLD